MNFVRSVSILLWLLLPFNTAKANQTFPQEQEEQQIITILMLVADNQLSKAMTAVESLLVERPNFKLAQLVRADLLAADGLIDTSFGIPKNKKAASRLHKLKLEAIQRLAGQQLVPQDKLPANLLKLSNQYQYALLFEMNTNRMFLVENIEGQGKIISSHYITIGAKGLDKKKEGDKRTPMGIYNMTSFIADNDLPELYGAGAYPINYPNAWDKLHNKTGNGIWLHGVPRSTYSRPPLDSRGCMVISNDSLSRLSPFLTLNDMPVILTDNVDWQPADAIKTKRSMIQRAFEDWYRDWMIGDEKTLQNHYQSIDNSTPISSGNRLSLAINDDQLEILSYPLLSGEEMIRTRIKLSTENQQSTQLEQFWKQQADGAWKIIFETSELTEISG